MKITFNRQEISNRIVPLMCAVSGKSTITASEGILIEAREPSECTMTTFDLEKGIRITVEAQVEEEGSYIINAQKFNQTLRVMEGEFITLTVDENMSAVFECGRSTHRTGALPGSDFPEIPRLTSDKGFVVSQAQFKGMLSQVSYAMGTNDPRQILNGCFVKTEGNLIRFVACDTFKLAVCSCKSEIGNIENSERGTDFAFILPAKTVNELTRLLSDNEDAMLKVYMSHRNIVLVIGNIIFFSRLITGDYIDYDRVIIKNHKITISAEKDRFIGALETAALITEEKIAGAVRSPVKLEICGDVLKVSANSSAGRIYDEVAIKHEGDDLSISFNNRYLLDSLRACSADRIKISLSSPLMSCNIEPDEELDGKNELFMLPPVRTKD